MADQITFTKDDLLDEKELRKLISPDMDLQKSTMTEIWQMGESIIAFLEQYINMHSGEDVTSASLKSTISKMGKTKKNNVKELFVMGAEYLYKVRQFFLNDTIYFSSGYMYADETGQRKLGEHRFSQDDMLKMIRASVSQTAIVLSHSLQEAYDAAVSEDLSKIWVQVEKWASEKEKSEKVDETPRKDGKGGVTEWFQSVDTDINVFFRFKGNRRGVVKFYGGIEGIGKGFNNGWLYEWIKAADGAGDLGFLYETMQNSTPTPLDPLFSRRSSDNVQGLRGGDYGTTKNGDTVTEQAKYGNTRIISFINILNSMKEVNNSLMNFINGEITEETVQEFLNIFIDSSLLDSYSRAANTTVDRMMQFLNKVAK